MRRKQAREHFKGQRIKKVSSLLNLGKLFVQDLQV